MTDLLELVPSKDTITVTLKNPNSKSDTFGQPLKNKDGTDMTVTVYAPHSREYKGAIHNQTQARIKKAQETKKRDFSFDDFEEITISLFVDTTVSWNITWKDEMPKYSKKLAKEVYEKLFWIRSQIDEEVQDTSVFT